MSLDEQYNWQSMKRRPLPRASRQRWTKRLVILALVLACFVYFALFLLVAKIPLPKTAVEIAEKTQLYLFQSNRLQIQSPPVSEPVSTTEKEEIRVLETTESSVESLLEANQFDLSSLETTRDIELTPEVSNPSNFLAISEAGPAQPIPRQQHEIDIASVEQLASKTLIQNTTVASENQLRLDPSATESTTTYLDQLSNQASNAAQNRAALANYNTIGDILHGQQSGSVDTSKPILLPTDLLFAFNSSDLEQNARTSLILLGALIDSSPNTLFRIEGYTDSIGEESSNLELSRLRAQSVADWLAEKLFINSDQIEVVGKGEANPLVATTGDPEEESLNRRVEIVIQTNSERTEEEPQLPHFSEQQEPVEPVEPQILEPQLPESIELDLIEPIEPAPALL